ncbi:MAG: helix-turn-helix domain-containing protein [Gammaproteobacteria bacterium]|nr:helix-turn-helix domain-containing protein [Gammaproteobacteria bacterium]
MSDEFAQYVAEIGQAAFGQKIGVSQGMVSNWVTRRARITAERAVQIHAEFGIPLHVMREDLWPAPSGELDDDQAVA